MENEKRSLELKEKIREKMLKYREQKCEKIVALQNKYALPVVTLRANYPGRVKNNSTSAFVVAEISKELERMFAGKILYHEAVDMPEGMTVFYVVQGDASTIKENTVYIEESHEIGRFSDIDVYECYEESSISRLELGYQPRKCYICHEDARECAMKKRHDQEVLIRFIEDSVVRYKKKRHLTGAAGQGNDVKETR